MPEVMTDEQLQQKALTVLEEKLGPLEALRFLALVRREPFDYRTWRDRSLGNLSIEQLFQRMEMIESNSS